MYVCAIFVFAVVWCSFHYASAQYCKAPQSCEIGLNPLKRWGRCNQYSEPLPAQPPLMNNGSTGGYVQSSVLMFADDDHHPLNVCIKEHHRTNAPIWEKFTAPCIHCNECHDAKLCGFTIWATHHENKEPRDVIFATGNEKNSLSTESRKAHLEYLYFASEIDLGLTFQFYKKSYVCKNFRIGQGPAAYSIEDPWQYFSNPWWIGGDNCTIKNDTLDYHLRCTCDQIIGKEQKKADLIFRGNGHCFILVEVAGNKSKKQNEEFVDICTVSQQTKIEKDDISPKTEPDVKKKSEL